MDKSKVCIMLDNGHGNNTPGKRSVDSSLREYKYCRNRVLDIKEQLEAEGYNVWIVTPEDYDVSLKTRVARINKKYAELKKNGMTGFCISIHNNAAGNGTQWVNATGWSVFISNNASQNSKNLANCLFDAAVHAGVKTRKPSNDQKYWRSNLYICKNTDCPCVLTENFFMDNKKECEWLLSVPGSECVNFIHTLGIKKYIHNL